MRLEKIDINGVVVHFTRSQKDALIRASIAIECNPAVIIRLGLKEFLEKGEDHIRKAIDAEDFAINEAIKAAKEAKI